MEREHLDSWPRWAPVAAAVPAVLFAALTPLVHFEGERRAALTGLLAIAVVPWLVEAADRRLPPGVFTAMVFVPIAIINWFPEALGLDAGHDAQLSIMVLIWLVGCTWGTRPARLSLMVTGLALAVPLVRHLLTGFEPWPFWAAGVFVAAGTGAVMARQQGLLTELRAAQSALAEEAAGAERQRIAREVHDVIAHHLTVTMLHVTAARMALRKNPGEAEDALAEAERLGRQALADVRRTVGLLHRDTGGTGGTATALPAAADIGALVDDYAAAGVSVRFDCRADLSALSPAAGLALYRSLQESLANAAKHAVGAAVRVSVTEDDGAVVLQVSDQGGSGGATDGRGLGLSGMRERVEALGGTVQAGPNGSGWVVTCRLPAEGAP